MQQSEIFECTGWVFPFWLDLQNVTFRNARFSECHFRFGADFSNSTFTGVADFTLSIFGEDSSHHVCPIYKEAKVSFSYATFDKNAFFDDAFIGFQDYGITFSHASFKYNAWFRRSVFMSRSWFDNCTFDGNATFVQTMFLSGANFSRVTFSSHTTFAATFFGERPPKPSRFDQTDLSEVAFRRSHVAHIHLSKAINLEGAEFDQARWLTLEVSYAQLRDEIARLKATSTDFAKDLNERVIKLLRTADPRVVVLEETSARNGGDRSDFETAERVYRDVRRSLEDHKHFREAHRFASRELEMRRLGSTVDSPQPWRCLRRGVLSWEAAYRLLSGYGDSVVLPIIWLAVAVLVLFPWLFVSFGLHLNELDYQHANPFDFANWPAYVDVVAFTIRTAALMPDPAGTKVGAGGQISQVILRLLGPLLAVLAAVAVRRRFRR